MERYDAISVEDKWRSWWQERDFYKTPENPGEKKFYLLEMFAYPSGDIHMGHFRNYTLGDAVARYLRMKGYNVLHPFGWDAFGLPAENAAIKHGIHPAKWTYSNIEKSRSTLKRMAISYDWSREIVTCREDYYKFTQWMFLLLFKRGLAYRKKAEVNWCPVDKTVLANEHVINGCCWRHPDVPVEKKELEQWFFKITSYADRLLEGLEKLRGWPASTVKQQRDWIGRSEGMSIFFNTEDGDSIEVFTTRPDTLWGVTFITLAPEHELSRRYSEHNAELKSYIDRATKKSEIERSDFTKEKEGIFTGKYAIHPATGERVPIWVADYVLINYGTGAVMGVPAHDQRDFEFAKRYSLPIKVVVKPKSGEIGDLGCAYDGPGYMINSGELNGTEVPDELEKVFLFLEEREIGRRSVQYKLRDWLISRQRYWGAPIPIIHCPKCGIVPVPENDLPVRLPENVENFIPQGRSPLEDIPEFINVACPKCGVAARRDPDTMDTFVCSSWYHLRYTDPHNPDLPFDPKKAEIWMPIDLYIGGDEHATGHLLYFRFFTKVLYDAGYLNVDEPCVRLFHQGMVKDEIGRVMSKSLGNVVEPAVLFDRYGVDIPRLAIFFFAPADQDIMWSDKVVAGVRRFVDRLWNLIIEATNISKNSKMVYDKSRLSKKGRNILRYAHRALDKAIKAYEVSFAFNTVIAAVMEFLNEVKKYNVSDLNDNDFAALYESLKIVTCILAPLAPHLGEEMWEKLGEKPSVFETSFPELDEDALREELLEIPIQVNGRVRDKIYAPPGTSREEIEKKALSSERIKKFLMGRDPKRIIFVPDKLVNIVV